MSPTIDKSDTEIKNDVLAELRYEPSVNVTDIGVLVKDGAVTLNGCATSYIEKWNAVKTTKRVAGVCAVADDIEVKFPESMRHTDADIAAAAINHLDWSSWSVPPKSVKVTVREGWITLEGQVEWNYQKDAAEAAVHHLSGVKGVSNMITIKPRVTAVKVETALRSAFERSALFDAKQIEVETSGDKVTLTGKVRNYAEREEAERVAWAAPGVLSVKNELTVGLSLFS